MLNMLLGGVVGGPAVPPSAFKLPRPLDVPLHEKQ
jgi:hypothetical protein